MKRVLIITYYWPPAGGSGVQRWLKMSKYLPLYGWKPIIYTPSNPEMPNVDETLLEDVSSEIEVLTSTIWQPYDIFRWLFRKKKSERMGSAGFSQDTKTSTWKTKLAFFLRGNLCVPDPKIFWKRKSVKVLDRYLQSKKIDAIISTGPPHSMHLIAMEIHKKHYIPWLADFRDPWTGIDYYQELNLLPFIDKIYKSQEKKVLRTANCVVAVTDGCKQEFEQIGGRKVEVVLNGYDEQDFPQKSIELRKYFTLCYSGVLFPKRNNSKFWQVLVEKINEEPQFKSNFRLEFVGRVDAAVKEEIQSIGLSDHTIFHGYLSHDKCISILQSAHHPLLMSSPLFGSPIFLTGKIYEYIATQKPLIALEAPEGEVCNLMKKYPIGYFIDYDNKEQMRQVIDLLFDNYLKGEYKLNNPSTVQPFTRRGQAKEIGELLNKITQHEYHKI